MATDNIYGITLKVWDELTGPLQKIQDSFSGLTGKIRKNKSEIQSLKKGLASFNQFDKLKAQADKSADALNKQQQRVAELSAQIKAAKSPSDALLKRYKNAEQRLRDLDAAHKQNRSTMSDHIRQMKAAGIDIGNLSRERERLSKSLDKQNDKLRVQNGLLAAQKKAWNGAKALGGKVWDTGKLALKTGAGVGAAGVGIIANFNQTAAEFERYQTILETLEGSKAKASQSFDWIKDFTSSTPYELSQVTDAFVKMRSYGLDPIEGGLLTTLGDTSAAMGKDIMQTVEAIADAVTGENERLKEFGIKASTKGNTITYNYIDSKGVQQSKKVDKNNRKMIQSTLQAIWNEKYAGNMDKMSRTWSGMWSNLMDHITNFKNLVMEQGAFDFLKDKLSDILFEIEVLATGGELEAWAKKISDSFVNFASKAWEVGTALWDVGVKVANGANKVATFVGGWDNLIAGIVAFKGLGAVASIAPVVGIVGQLAAGITSLGIAALANPLGMVIAGAVALGTAAYFLVKNWDTVKAWFSENFPILTSIIQTGFALWELKIEAIKAAGRQLKAVWEGIFNWFKEKFDWIGGKIQGFKDMKADIGVKVKSGLSNAVGSVKEFFGGGRATGGPVSPGRFYRVNENGPELLKTANDTFLMDPPRGEVVPLRSRLQQPSQTIPSIMAQRQALQKVSGNIHVRIDSDKPVRVKKLESHGIDLALDTGMIGFAP